MRRFSGRKKGCIFEFRWFFHVDKLGTIVLVRSSSRAFNKTKGLTKSDIPTEKKMRSQMKLATLRWTATLAMLSVALGCPKFEEVKCFCRDRMLRTCHDIETREEKFISKRSSNEMVLTCADEELLDTYFDVSLHRSYVGLSIKKCRFTEKWTGHFVNSSITHLSLNMTNESDFNNNTFLLKELGALRELNVLEFSIKELKSGTFDQQKSLETLNLRKNQLVNLPVNLFSHLNELKSLDLRKNNLAHLPDLIFSNLRKLQNLYLSNNKFTSIGNHLFHDLYSLKYLHVQENDLQTLPEDIFVKNVKLEEIYLQGNFLKKLPKSLLKNLQSLEILDISNNPVTNLENDFLKNQRSLEKVYLNNCNLTSIPKNPFANSLKLGIVEMKENKFNSVERTWFDRINNIHELDLSDNNISSLVNSPFQHGTNLKILNLSKNKLKAISSKDLIGLKSIQTLNVSNNVLEDVEDQAFEDLKTLHSLDIGNNKVPEILEYYSDKMKQNLVFLDASGNEITNLPHSNKYTNLREFRLERNKITSLTVVVKKSPFSDSDTHIYLQHNKIKTINLDLLKPGSDDRGDARSMNCGGKSVVFHLQGNPLICDCRLDDFWRYLSGTGSWFRCADFPHPQTLTCTRDFQNVENITTVQRRYFTTRVLQQCPHTCHCSKSKCDETVTVECGGLNMKNLPENVPENVTILHMENNNLTELGDLKKIQWKNLKEIYVDHNLLSHASEWFIPPNLQKLSLRGNLLSVLPDIVKMRVNRIRTFQVNLADNLWKCECSIIQFKTWLSEHSSQILDIDKILCYTDLEKFGKILSDEIMKISKENFCPVDLSYYKLEMKIFVISTAVVTALAVAGICIYYNNKPRILAYMYRQRRF